MGAGDLGDGAEGVGHAGGSLVVGHQDGLDRGVIGKVFVHVIRVDGLAVGSFQFDYSSAPKASAIWT